MEEPTAEMEGLCAQGTSSEDDLDRGEPLVSDADGEAAQEAELILQPKMPTKDEALATSEPNSFLPTNFPSRLSRQPSFCSPAFPFPTSC